MYKWLAILFLMILFMSPANGQQSLQTKWSKDLDPENVLPEYPRPQLVRSDWQNLNGWWDMCITRDGQAPVSYSEKILVPYPLESQLSRVGKKLTKNQTLWYRKQIVTPQSWSDKNVLIHFGAVDWEATIYINGYLVGQHKGGYDPFSFDITNYLVSGEKQEIVVAVWDPTSDGKQPIGKQKTKPGGIFYTPVSGIWQTVWLEPVSKQHIDKITLTPDIDTKTIAIHVNGIGISSKASTCKVMILDKGKLLSTTEMRLDETSKIPIKNPKLWSPDTPHLYDVHVELTQNGQVIDQVKSYFGMRKISMSKDKDGYQRLMLNNQYLFHFGTLDQGWWPDGLYTAPSDEALRYDIEMTKKMGFNTIRKHVKVEPARWYYHCDKMGMMVWQDMPNGDGLGTWRSPSGYDFIEDRRAPFSAHQYKREWKAILTALYNAPSIVTWVPFNEAWGQFETKNIIKWTMNQDTTRLVDGPSGGNYFPVGHMVDTHVYPGPGIPNKQHHASTIFENRALILGEFGGLGLPLEGHLWQKNRNWGYRNIKDKTSLIDAYSNLIVQLPALIKKGLTAAIYTQTTDVEGEVNGLMTYDREVTKMDVKKLLIINQKLYRVKIEK